MKQRDVVIVGAGLAGLSHEETAHEGWVDLP
jgi:monoamine oxidase